MCMVSFMNNILSWVLQFSLLSAPLRLYTQTPPNQIAASPSLTMGHQFLYSFRDYKKSKSKNYPIYVKWMTPMARK